MAMQIAPYFRQYELPWSPSDENESRFRKLLRNLLIALLVIGIIIPLLPRTEPAKRSVQDLPERVVQLIERVAPGPVQPPGALAPLAEQLGLLEHREVLADRGARDVEGSRDLASREFAFADQAQDAAPPRLTERPEPQVERLRCHCGRRAHPSAPARSDAIRLLHHL